MPIGMGRPRALNLGAQGNVARVAWRQNVPSCNLEIIGFSFVRFRPPKTDPTETDYVPDSIRLVFSSENVLF